MKKIICSLFILFLYGPLFLQGQTSTFSISIEPLTVEGIPGLQSYTFVQDQGKWLIIGGRLDGLHRRQPWAAFDVSGNNTFLYVIDPQSGQHWQAPLNTLDLPIFEQLQSTNMQFHQDGKWLYIVGGYGYSNTLGDFITFPYLTVVEVPEVIEAIINNESYASFFHQISNEQFAVTGGHLGYLDDFFYLVCGQRFDGAYNPMNMPTFVQEYTNQIRKFKLVNNNNNFSVSDYSEITDEVNLHRRDYNLVPQIFPDKSLGFTVFTGVFQYNVDLPFLNTVDVFANDYEVNNSFNQYLSQYHSAVVPVYDNENNEMSSVFFGGISQFYFDENNETMIEDQNVPFVKTISQVTRFADGSMEEYKLPIEMPALQGAGAEFIIHPDIAVYDNGVIKLDALSDSTHLIGYIFGGIESSAPNIFFTNEGNQSEASSLIYKVFLQKNTTTQLGTIEESFDHDLHLQVFPNPVEAMLTLQYQLPFSTPARIFVQDSLGRIVKQIDLDDQAAGMHQQTFSTGNLLAGNYIITFDTGFVISAVQFVKN